MSTDAEQHVHDLITDLFETGAQLTPAAKARFLAASEQSIADARLDLALSTPANRPKRERELDELFAEQAFMLVVFNLDALGLPPRRGPSGIRELVLTAMRRSVHTRWSPALVHDALRHDPTLRGSQRKPPTRHAVQLAMYRMAESGELARVGRGLYVIADGAVQKGGDR